MLTAKGLTIFRAFRSIIRTIISDAFALFILFISAGNFVTSGALARTICDRLEKIFMDLCRMRFGGVEGISWVVS